MLRPPLGNRIGGALCLDFCNTVSRAGTAAERDDIADAAGLAAWCRARGLPASPTPILGPAVALRGAVRRAFLARAGGETIAAGDLQAIWSAYRDGLARAALIADGPTAAVRLAADDPLAPIARSAVELLCQRDVPVRLCDTPHCGWLFLDATRNRSRRFCSMRYCGNRTRARVHYARQRARSAQP